MLKTRLRMRARSRSRWVIVPPAFGNITRGRSLCEHPDVTAEANRVRPAKEGDRRSLALLLAAVAEERDGIAAEPPIDVEKLAANWQLDGTLIALATGVVVGELRVEPSWLGFGEIGMMVAADWRGRGVGAALVAAAIEWARARGLRKLFPRLPMELGRTPPPGCGPELMNGDRPIRTN